MKKDMNMKFSKTNGSLFPFLVDTKFQEIEKKKVFSFHDTLTVH